jgi:hypothetical protein
MNAATFTGSVGSLSGAEWAGQPVDDAFMRKWTQAVRITALVFVGMQIAGGVARWVLDMVGAAPLTYLPNVMMWACIGAMLYRDAVMQRTTRGVLLFALLIATSMLVGWINTGNAGQVVFGLWILTPFLFGLMCAPVLLKVDRTLFWVMVATFGLAAGGTIIHSFVSYPWVGVKYSVGGVELEGAREWHIEGGHQRLSGLARSSFDVAGQILMATALMALQIKKGWARFFIWVAAAVGISLSTSKGILLALLMTAFAVEGVIGRKQWMLLGIAALGMVWLFVPPLMGWTMDWSEAARTDLNNPIYGSFIDRMNDMWPRALELATHRGTPLLGRGLGGIGTPLSMFELGEGNAGDNLFVFCLVLIGVFAIPLFIAGYMALIRLFACLDAQAVQLAVILAVAVNWYGGVSNILEHAFMSFGFGLMCRVLVMGFVHDGRPTAGETAGL